MIITTTPTVEGWRITEYKGVVFGEVVSGVNLEVFIPAKWGYGNMKLDGIPANSTLIFEIELVKIERA